MFLASGTKLGPYEIQIPLGAGGMGEVYRALDTRLDRTVAIKVLPEHLSQSPEAKQRFVREARAISSLNHPNICTLHDVGHQNGTDYLVMEFLEGETLADRLTKGSLPVAQILKYGADICEGLDRAHKNGVVHRDLKPGNIMLTKAGAKLMDFGLAKGTPAMAAVSSSSLTMEIASPMATHPLTGQGFVVGTFQYMSPEQVEGKEADARSDIFALGSVLYEMATGKRAFEGKSNLSVASAIIEKEPDPITTVQPMAPPALDHVVRGCLAKNPDDRWQSAGDIARELRWISSSESSQTSVAALLRRPARRRWERTGWIAVAVVLLGLVGWLALRPQPSTRVLQAFLTPPPGATFEFNGDYSGPPVLSRDGSRLVFSARVGKEPTSLYVQALDNTVAVKLDGTGNAAFPFWSADGKSIAFFADGKLRKIPAAGGPVTVLADAPGGRGGAWSPENVIVYTPDFRDSLWKISANGGTPERLTILDSSRHSTHRWPSFLPDGKHFLFFATNHSGINPDQNGIYVGSVESHEMRLVLPSDSAAQYASGHLLYHLQTALMTQGFDPATATLSGDPVPITDHIQYDGSVWRTTFSASDDGTLIAVSGASTANTELVWVDRTGKDVGYAVAERFVDLGGPLAGMRLSPDGNRLAITVGQPKADIFVFDLVHGTKTRITFNPAQNIQPSWSPDGQRIVFSELAGSRISAGSTIHSRLANGGGQDEALLGPENNTVPVTFSWPQWSADGKYLVYSKATGPSGGSIWAVQTSGEKKPFLVVQPQSQQGTIQFSRLSPDSKWLAYTSTESGREELYVTSFPRASGRWQVSQNGGTAPVWRADGKELYFYEFSGSQSQIDAVEVFANGEQLETRNYRKLFPLNHVLAGGNANFEVTPDGRRFLIPVQPEVAAVPISLTLNWTSKLGK